MSRKKRLHFTRLALFLCLLALLPAPACDDLLLGESTELPTLADQLMAPESLDDGLEVSTSEAEGLNAGQIEALLKYLHEDTSINYRSLLIARNNKLVVEAYFNSWTRDRRQDMRSATKSITSAIVGIAIDQNIIAGVDEPVLGFFPEYPSFQNWDEQKAETTLEDLLRMRTGLLCNDWVPSSPGNEERMYETDDWVKFILDLPVSSNAPGTVFTYCTGAPVTLGAVVANALGRPFPDFADELLFAPLGITDYVWESRPGGTDTGGHLHLRPRDMLKFGLLFLNDGSWNGRQLVSASWVAQSTAANGAVPGGPPGQALEYGYLWWVNTQGTPFYFANGNGGQLIIVVPSLDMVIVFTGGAYGTNFLPRLLGLVNGRILPAVEG